MLWVKNIALPGLVLNRTGTKQARLTKVPRASQLKTDSSHFDFVFKTSPRDWTSFQNPVMSRVKEGSVYRLSGL